MREILFRGKAIDGNWYYGVPLVFTEDFVCMTAPHTYNKSVIPSTVGQFTGLTDKNGNRVFEGDIIRITAFAPRILMGVVLWSEDDQCYIIAKDQSGQCHIDDFGNYGKPKYYEVIGNIHDNPGLLEVE